MENFQFSLSTAVKYTEGATILLCGDIVSNLMKAHELGYVGIEIHMRETQSVDVDKILEVCRKNDVSIASLVTGRLFNDTGIGIADPDESKASMIMEGLKRYVDLAHSLKTNIVLGWIRGRADQFVSKAQYFSILGTKLKELDIYSDQKNVKLFIEAINRYEVDVFNTGIEILDFINEFDLENSYVHLDTFHMNIEETDMLQTIKDCKDKLGYVHFADNTRLYPGSGSIDFRAILQTLKEINYNGFIDVECFPIPDGITAAKEAMKTIEKSL